MQLVNVCLVSLLFVAGLSSSAGNGNIRVDVHMHKLKSFLRPANNHVYSSALRNYALYHCRIYFSYCFAANIVL